MRMLSSTCGKREELLADVGGPLVPIGQPTRLSATGVRR